jgi:AcrR family transcriptional regulator
MSESNEPRRSGPILHAAKGLYEKNGVGGVPFDDFAESAGVCRTTVFKHLRTRASCRAQPAWPVAEIAKTSNLRAIPA